MARLPVVEMTEGPIFKRLLRYALPIAIVNIMQRLFNTADIAILGMFAGDMQVAAVGATSSLITLINSTFIALSAGVNVLVARSVGAKNMEQSRKTVGTAACLGLLCGIMLMLIVQAFGRTFLTWMKCDPALLSDASKYMAIYYCGAPFIVLYHFLASSLRATGDSTRPMLFMLIASVVNVLLNIFFVAILHIEVVGVAVATLISKVVALTLSLRVLLKNNGYSKIERKNLHLDKDIVRNILRIGLPTGLGSISFYVSNVVIQSAVNSLGATYVTANAVSSQFDGFIYTVGGAIATATMVFVAQNVGAKKVERVKSVVGMGVACATVVSLGIGILFVTFSELLCSIVTRDAQVIAFAQQRMHLLCLTYFTASIMEVFTFSLRAMGWYKSTVLISFVAGLGVRVVWTKLIWPLFHNLRMLYASFPVSNLVAISICLILYSFALKKLKRNIEAKLEQ